jgi:hypothetical protein
VGAARRDVPTSEILEGGLKMQRLDLATGLVLAVVGLLAFFYAGQTLPVRAGMMPRVVSMTLAVLGFALALRGGIGVLRSKSKSTDDHVAHRFAQSWPLLAVSVGATAVYFLLVPAIGLILSTTAFIACVAVATGYRRPLQLLIAAVGFSVGVDVVFRQIFLLRLPEDPLRTFIGLG